MNPPGPKPRDHISPRLVPNPLNPQPRAITSVQPKALLTPSLEAAAAELATPAPEQGHESRTVLGFGVLDFGIMEKTMEAAICSGMV